MLAPWPSIAPSTSATLMLVLLAASVVLVIVVLLVALGVALIATFRPALLRLGSRGSGSGGRLGGSRESRRVISTLSRRGRRCLWWFSSACGRVGTGIGWLAHTRSGDRIGARSFIGSVTIRIGFAFLWLTAIWARPTAATMGTSTFVHAPVLVCGRASTAQ